jgi:hypothetical protein
MQATLSESLLPAYQLFCPSASTSVATFVCNAKQIEFIGHYRVATDAAHCCDLIERAGEHAALCLYANLLRKGRHATLSGDLWL